LGVLVGLNHLEPSNKNAMNTHTANLLAGYWSPQEISVNLIVFANLLGALMLGLLVGYERSYHGRAAGMRTYGLVCMASCAITVIAGYPAFWYGGAAMGSLTGHLPPDPTRVIQGVVTGVGFLGAGVIMREGMNISGLTTAASIWSSSAMGILVGVGFYSAAILLALLSASLMMWASLLEKALPSRPAVAIRMTFRAGYNPSQSALEKIALARGYEIAGGSLYIQCISQREEWRFVAISISRDKGIALPELSKELRLFEGVEDYSLAHARN
jgi:putative Mg2+ transporter-C (MgtC) family protein